MQPLTANPIYFREGNSENWKPITIEELISDLLALLDEGILIFEKHSHAYSENEKELWKLRGIASTFPIRISYLGIDWAKSFALDIARTITSFFNDKSTIGDTIQNLKALRTGIKNHI